jgi:hypothetical protein
MRGHIARHLIHLPCRLQWDADAAAVKEALACPAGSAREAEVARNFFADRRNRNAEGTGLSRSMGKACI